MKKVCFIVSHLGSSSSELIDILNGNPRCQFYSTNVQYDGPDSLEWMFGRGHKCKDSSAVYGDHLLLNISLSSRKLYEFCKFIYVIRPARGSLEKVCESYPGERSVSHYAFRLRRICEMARRTPGAVMLTWDDLASGRGLRTIEEYLNLKKPLDLGEGRFLPCEKDVDESLVRRAQDAYERYFYYIKSLDLRRPKVD